MEEGDEPMPKRVDEFTASHSATNESQAPNHTCAQSSGQRQYVQAPWLVIEDDNTTISSRLNRI